MSSKSTIQGSERPTLPSIHTLELPLLTRPTLPNVQYIPEINARPIRLNSPTKKMNHDRHVSTSSSATNSSRSSSPTSPQSGSGVSRLPSPLPSNFRLIPCEMENAEAVILLPPPGAQDANLCNYSSRNGKGGILLVGSDLHKICRNPQRPLAKGARVHPYRVALGENPDKSRRASVISVTAFPTAPPRLS